MENTENESKEIPEYYTATEAIALTKEVMGVSVARSTLLSWIEKHDLGFQLGGKGSYWHIHKKKFDAFLEKNKKA